MADIQLILVGGKSHNGKGEFSRYLEDIIKQNGKYVIRCSLSTYIRDILKNDFFWDGVMTQEARKFMADTYKLGTAIYPYHMARRVWERDIVPYIKNNKENIVIVESFREKNSYDYFKQLVSNITTIKLVRPGFNAVEGELLEHVSEIDLDNFEFDYYVTNDSAVEKLKGDAEKIYRDILMEKFFKQYC